MIANKRQKAKALTKYRYEHGPQWDIAPNTCAYCGVRSTTEDHVIPLSGMAQLLHIAELVSWTVPACSECNCALSNKNPYKINGVNSPRRQFERKRQIVRAYITKKYLGKYKRPLWTDEELKNRHVGPGKPEDDQHISRQLAEWVHQSYTHEDIVSRLNYNCFAYNYSYRY
jgi:hypothetical protein